MDFNGDELQCAHVRFEIAESAEELVSWWPRVVKGDRRICGGLSPLMLVLMLVIQQGQSSRRIAELHAELQAARDRNMTAELASQTYVDV